MVEHAPVAGLDCFSVIKVVVANDREGHRRDHAVAAGNADRPLPPPPHVVHRLHRLVDCEERDFCLSAPVFEHEGDTR